MDRVQRRGATLLFAFAGFAYLLDRLTKLWAERTLQDAPADVIPGVLTLRTIQDARRVVDTLRGNVKRAVVLGGGALGLNSLKSNSAR